MLQVNGRSTTSSPKSSHALVPPCCKNHLLKLTVIKRTAWSQMSPGVLNLQKHKKLTTVTRDPFHLTLEKPILLKSLSSHLKITNECTFKDIKCYRNSLLKPSGLLIWFKSLQDCTAAGKTLNTEWPSCLLGTELNQFLKLAQQRSLPPKHSSADNAFQSTLQGRAIFKKVS